MGRFGSGPIVFRDDKADVFTFIATNARGILWTLAPPSLGARRGRLFKRRCLGELLLGKGNVGPKSMREEAVTAEECLIDLSLQTALDGGSDHRCQPTDFPRNHQTTRNPTGFGNHFAIPLAIRNR